MQKFIPILLLCLGIGFLYFGINEIIKTHGFLKRAIETNGTVVEIEENISTDSNGDTSTTYYPIVKFRAGKNHFTFKSKIGSSNSHTFKKGQNLKILYDDRQPENAKIKSFIQIWASSLILVVLGASLILASTFLILENFEAGH